MAPSDRSCASEGLELRRALKDEHLTAVTELSALHLLAGVRLTKGSVPVNVGHCVKERTLPD